MKDINLLDFGGSAPFDLHAAGGKVYFFAHDGSGYGLWVSDGTEAGTAPLLDVSVPGAFSQPLITSAADAGGRLFFIAVFAPDANDNGDTALWRTDGTPAGTVRLTPEAVQVSRADDVVAVGNQVFFVASDGAHGYDLWVSDGTAAGTRRVIDLDTDARFFTHWRLTAFQGRIFFVASVPGTGEDLWRSDGTAAGTVLVETFALEPHDLIEHAGRLWLIVPTSGEGDQIWSSDGTAAGTAPAHLYEGSSGFSVSRLASAGSRLFFWAGSNGASGLWVSDGTAAGTQRISDAAIYDAIGLNTPAVFNGLLVFSSEQGASRPILWKSDGTAAGTSPLLDRDGRPIRDAFFYRPFAGQLFFTTYGEGALYQSDGTQAGTFKLLDLRSRFEATTFFELAPAGPRLFFRKWDRDHGSELWALETE